MTRRLAIVTDDPGWHGAQLEAAFARLGWQVTFVSLRSCAFDLGAEGPGLQMPGFEDRLPDGVFVRGVPGGTLEEVVFHLDALHALREAGVAVYNDARVIERTVDKGMTSFLLHRANIPTPATWVTVDAAHAQAILLREYARGGEVVLKPLFGSQGNGLLRLAPGDSLPSFESVGGVFYLQRFVDTGSTHCDWRIFVINGRPVAAMRREADHWITNVARGGRGCGAILAPAHAELAARTSLALGLGYGGIDLIVDRDGRPWVVEVNGIPAWKALQGVTLVPIADHLAAGFHEAFCRDDFWELRGGASAP